MAAESHTTKQYLRKHDQTMKNSVTDQQRSKQINEADILNLNREHESLFVQIWNHCNVFSSPSYFDERPVAPSILNANAIEKIS